MLRGNKVLTSLKLQKCDIGPEGLSELCSALEVNTTLTELDLSLNMFHDHSLASLGKLSIITIAVMTVSEEVIDAQLKTVYIALSHCHTLWLEACPEEVASLQCGSEQLCGNVIAPPPLVSSDIVVDN